MALSKDKLDFVQRYSDNNESMLWKAELRHSDGRSTLIDGSWSDPEHADYEGEFIALRLDSRHSKRMTLAIELMPHPGDMSLSPSPSWPSQTTVRTRPGDLNSTSRSLVMSEQSELYVHPLLEREASATAAADSTCASEGASLNTSALGASTAHAVVVSIKNGTSTRVSLHADNLCSFTSAEVAQLEPTAVRAIHASPGEVLRAASKGTDIWEWRVQDEGETEHCVEIRPCEPQNALWQAKPAVSELLESIAHQERRLEALHALVELSEGLDSHGKNDETSSLRKLRVGLAFKACRGFAIILPLLCHADDQLQLGALELVASICDTPCNRKHVDHLLGRLVEMVSSSCGRQEQLVAVISALDSVCRDSNTNAQAVSVYLQEGLDRGDSALPVLSAFADICDGTSMVVPVATLLRRANVRTAKSRLAESGRRIWCAQILKQGWEEVTETSEDLIGKTAFSTQYGEGHVFDVALDRGDVSVDFEVSGSTTVSVSDEVLFVSNDRRKICPWDEEGGSSSSLRRNPSVARAADVAAWMTRQMGKEGRICELYAGLLYRRGVTGKALMEMTEESLAALHVHNGDAPAILSRIQALRGFLGRYVCEEIIYESTTTKVIRALDRLGTSAIGRRGTGQQVAMKLMTRVEAFEQELRVRDNLDGDTCVRLIRVHAPSQYTWPVGSAPPSVLTAESCVVELNEDASAQDSRLAGQYVLVLEYADGNNLETWASSRPLAFSGGDLSAARDLLTAAASHLRELNESGWAHGDVALANFVSVEGRLRVIDFDLSLALGDQHRSLLLQQRGCCPPELARRWRAFSLYSAAATKDGCDVLPWARWLDKYAAVPLSGGIAVDIWGFGVAMLRLLAGPVAEIADPELVADWDETKPAVLERVHCGEARDLICWCLQTNPNRRPRSFDELLRHPFLSGDGQPHFPVPADECAVRLHRALEESNAGKTNKMFLNGTAHGTQTAPGNAVVAPLHRAARLNNSKIVTRILAELVVGFSSPGVPFSVPKWSMAHGYNCLHLAALFDAADVVDALLLSGCDTRARNANGLTAWATAEAAGAEAALQTFRRHATAGHVALSQEMAASATDSREAVPLSTDTGAVLAFDRLSFWRITAPQPCVNWSPSGHYFDVEHVFPPVLRDGKLVPRLAVLPLPRSSQLVLAANNGGVSPAALTLINLRHRNLAPVYGFVRGPTPDSTEPVWMVATEAAESTLAALRGQPQPASVVCAIAEDLARGLAYLHAAGLVHLGLQPQDVALVPESGDAATMVPRIRGYGLRGATASLPARSAAYLSPEGRWKEESQPHTDVYALSIILWELVHGRPFATAFDADDGDTPDGDVAAALMARGERPEIAVDCSLLLRLVISACWESVPEDRPACAAVAEVISLLTAHDAQDGASAAELAALAQQERLHKLNSQETNDTAVDSDTDEEGASGIDPELWANAVRLALSFRGWRQGTRAQRNERERFARLLCGQWNATGTVDSEATQELVLLQVKPDGTVGGSVDDGDGVFDEAGADCILANGVADFERQTVAFDQMYADGAITHWAARYDAERDMLVDGQWSGECDGAFEGTRKGGQMRAAQRVRRPFRSPPVAVAAEPEPQPKPEAKVGPVAEPELGPWLRLLRWVEELHGAEARARIEATQAGREDARQQDLQELAELRARVAELESVRLAHGK